MEKKYSHIYSVHDTHENFCYLINFHENVKSADCLAIVIVSLEVHFYRLFNCIGFSLTFLYTKKCLCLQAVSDCVYALLFRAAVTSKQSVQSNTIRRIFVNETLVMHQFQNFVVFHSASITIAFHWVHFFFSSSNISHWHPLFMQFYLILDMYVWSQCFLTMLKILLSFISKFPCDRLFFFSLLYSISLFFLCEMC